MNNSRKNFDSGFCGSLPLHNINLIQPHGFLIVLNKEDLSVLQVSENCEVLFEEPAPDIINAGFTRFIDEGTVTNLKDRVASGVTDKIPLRFFVTSKANKKLDCIAVVHFKVELLILEIEVARNYLPFIDIYQELKFSMAAINVAQTVEETCNIAARELKKLSGFNKVMVYQFDEQWNGTVKAEVSDPGLDNYLGLTFPASDIPKQARDLYLRNPYRLIPTREYQPVKLYPVRNPKTNTFLDLSDCNLRSVPSVHLEYLKNMEVMSSMSTRILVNDQLWGLISCHHKEEKVLGYEECSVFELLSDVISAKISSIQNRESFDFRNSLNEKRTKLLDLLYFENNLVKGLLKHEVNLMDLLNAGGVALMQNNILHTIGQVPQDPDIKNLILWLQNKNVESVFVEENLPAEYDEAINYAAIGSGLVAIPINTVKGDYILAFRPEVVTTVNWGGNPDEAINFESDGKKYHPRNSFRLWKENVYQTSAPWHRDELTVAEEVRSFIFEYSSKYPNN